MVCECVCWAVFGTSRIDMAGLLMMPNEWVGPQCNCYLAASGAIMCHLYALPETQGHAIWV